MSRGLYVSAPYLFWRYGAYTCQQARDKGRIRVSARALLSEARSGLIELVAAGHPAPQAPHLYNPYGARQKRIREGEGRTCQYCSSQLA